MALHRLLPLRCLLLLVALALTGTASYTVRPGDTLSEIAARLGVRTSALASANGISDLDHVVIGTRLRVPSGSGGSGGGRHVVAPGETLSGIAARHGLSTRALAAANGMAVGDLLLSGRSLVLSGGSSSAPRGSASRAAVGTLLAQTANRYGVSPSLVKAIAWQESGWQQGVVSPDNAIGIMQVLPSTGRFVGRSLVGRSLDLSDPADNVEAGVAFLAYVRRLSGSDRMALAGYYQGLASVRRNGMYRDTEQYIDNVFALRNRF